MKEGGNSNNSKSRRLLLCQLSYRIRTYQFRGHTMDLRKWTMKRKLRYQKRWCILELWLGEELRVHGPGGQSVTLKEIDLGGCWRADVEMKLQSFGHLIERAELVKRTLSLSTGSWGGRRGDNQRWNQISYLLKWAMGLEWTTGVECEWMKTLEYSDNEVVEINLTGDWNWIWYIKNTCFIYMYMSKLLMIERFTNLFLTTNVFFFLPYFRSLCLSFSFFLCVWHHCGKSDFKKHSFCPGCCLRL